jgi:hypothetical protein
VIPKNNYLSRLKIDLLAGISNFRQTGLAQKARITGLLG